MALGAGPVPPLAGKEIEEEGLIRNSKKRVSTSEGNDLKDISGRRFADVVGSNP